MNLFLTEDGVLKLGYYGLITQAECYSIRKMDCEGLRSFAPEVFRGEYEMKSDVWSLGIALIELMGITPYSDYDESELPTKSGVDEYPYDKRDNDFEDMSSFLKCCFDMEVDDRYNVDELLDVSRMGWGMMNRIHLWRNAKRERRKGCFNW